MQTISAASAVSNAPDYSPLLYAVTDALETLGEREENASLVDYPHRLKAALIDTVDASITTGDLKGMTNTSEIETHERYVGHPGRRRQPALSPRISLDLTGPDT